MDSVFVLIAIYLVLEHHLPFRGLLTNEMSESIKTLGFRHYLVAWLPTWWFILGGSTLAAGIGLGCSIWAIVDDIHGLPVNVPVIIALGNFLIAFSGFVVPITLAWFKDRSEQRQQSHLQDRVKELEIQVEINRQGHSENAINIQKVTVATQKIAEAAEKIVEAKEHQVHSDDAKLH